MLKKTLGLVITAVMLFGVFGLAACNRHKVYEEGYFKYIIVGENSRFPDKNNKAVVAIIGLTESGQEQEVIDFPRIIDGKDVRFIGYSKLGFYTNEFAYHLESENLKKIFLHENVSYVYGESLSGNWDLMICSTENLNILFNNIYDYVGNFYIYKSLYDNYLESSKVYSANIEFLNNHSIEINKGYYRLDNIKAGEKIPEPPAPEREGHEFTNWFTESECLSIWNFDDIAEIQENEEFRLYAGWRTI